MTADDANDPQPDGELRRPLTVYLDSADWAYMQEGKAPDLEKGLKLAARGGAIVPLLSNDHLAEIAGLTSGLQDRIEYVASFPAAARLLCDTTDVLVADGKRLANEAVAAPSKRYHVNVQAMDDLGVDGLRELVERYGRAAREGHRMFASVQRRSRSAAPERTARELQARRKQLTAFIRGDADAFVASLPQLDGWRGKIRDTTAAAVTRTCGRLVDILKRNGIVPFAALRFDPVFVTSVRPFLPDECHADAEWMDQTYRFWSQPKHRHVAPSLACYAAMADSIDKQRDREYKASESVDASHAANAPLVDVFTCDKRNVDPLRKVLREVGSATRVVRTKRAVDVIGAIAELLGTERMS